MADLHIASCIVRTYPSRSESVAAQIGAREHCDVIARDENGKLVLLSEGNSTGDLLEHIDAIRALEGVLSVDLVYQHAEDESLMKEALPCP